MILPDYVNNETKQLLETEAVNNYKKVMFNNLRYSYPLLLDYELENAITWAIANNNKLYPAKIYNNYTKKEINGTTLDILRYIESLEPVLTSSGVMFKKRVTADNPLARMVQGFMSERKEYKSKMFKYDRGTKEYAYYNLYQLLCKLNANALYGILAAATSIFFNLHIAEGITRQGRSYITQSIMFFESFLANNVKFNSVNEIITFIDNICNEPVNLDINNYITENIDRGQCFFRLLNNADPMVWIPTEKEMCLVWEIIADLPEDKINRIYYKNNLYTFCDLPVINDMIIDILKSLEVPFINPNDPPEEIKDKLDELLKIIKEFVYYPHTYIDKLSRAEYMPRDVIAIIDTDSTIISLDAWYRFILNKVYNIDMPLKTKKFDIFSMENGDNLEFKTVKTKLDYDFYKDEIIEIEEQINPSDMIPQVALRHAIINIISYICGNLIIDYLNKYCETAGSNVKDSKCMMVMKNEFEFKAILMTLARKNYASIQERQEEKIIPNKQEKRFVVTGLAINKSTLPEGIKKAFQDIIYNDILNKDDINQIDIMKKLIIIEKQIAQSIMNKETTYYTPDNVAPMRSYAQPMSQNGVKAIIMYNAVCTPELPAINLNERNRIFKIKLNLNKNNVELIKNSDPIVYQRLIDLMNNPAMCDKLDTIGFLMDSDIPDWVLKFVDIKSITNSLLKNFPIESIGLQRLQNDFVNYSNIISI